MSLQGIENAQRRAVLKGLGYTDSDFSKPVVALVSSHNPLAVGQGGLKKLEDVVYSALTAEGVIPIRFYFSSLSEDYAYGSIAGKYFMPSRDVTTKQLESIFQTTNFDGMLILAQSNVALSSYMLAAAQINIPTMFLSCGPNNAAGENIYATALIQAIAKSKLGRVSPPQFSHLENTSVSFNGNWVDYESNASSILLEALGLSMWGNSTIPYNTSRRLTFARQTASRLIRLIENNITPRKILSAENLKSAVNIVSSLGISTEHITSLLSLSYLLGIKLNYASFDNAKVPTLLNPTSDMLAFFNAGGMRAVVKELLDAKLITDKTISVNEGTLIEQLKGAKEADSKTIYKVSAPFAKTSGLASIRGSVADSALVRVSNLKAQTFSGRAKVYNSLDDALLAIYSNYIKSGDVLVVRYEGAKGGPGMVDITPVCAALAALGVDAAVITDGRCTNNMGLVVASLCYPEAIEGGNIALIQDNDKIDIDLNKARINMEANAKELASRKKKWNPKQKELSPFMQRYAKDVGSPEVTGGLKLRAKK
ncbi:MAG: dihydroxy-acid dehydratase [Firmicutes bacterium]|nr:dihydroxy-acid dehydratase [Bacillota bacterium]